MNAALKSNNQNKAPCVEEIRTGDKKAFEALFFSHYKNLCRLAAKITDSSDRARDIVQEVFLRLWRLRETLEITSSLKAYLYKAVWNEALNVEKKQMNRRELIRKFAQEADFQTGQFKSDSSGPSQELIRKIWRIVEEMPERRRFVFTLHRRHGLSYKEIGTVMDISRKTVENHMGLALKEIRTSLIEMEVK